MRNALLAFITHNGIPASKYHETLTRAWILAVHHFMSTSGGAASADAFIDSNPSLLSTQIMLSHYSAETLFPQKPAHNSSRRTSTQFCVMGNELSALPANNCC